MRLPKYLRRIAIMLLAGALVVTVATYYASNYVEEKVKGILENVSITASSVSANILTGSIELTGLDWTQPNDSLPQFPNHLFVNNVRLEGISAYQLLKNKKLQIDKLALNVGEFQWNRSLKNSKTDSTESEIDLEVHKTLCGLS